MNRMLTEEEKELYLPVIQDYLSDVKFWMDCTLSLSLNLSGKGLTPYKVLLILEELGYQQTDSTELEGWEMNYSIRMSKEYEKDIKICGRAMIFEIELRSC